MGMDEHEQRAREWYAQELNEQPPDCPCYEQHIEALATLLRSTAAAAVAAERERWKRAADAVITAWDHDEIGQVDGALIDALRSPAAAAASPAQAERVSEEGWAANAERQLTRNGGWHVPGLSEDEHAVRFETVTDAHARGCRETQVRLAARLRARADEEDANMPPMRAEHQHCVSHTALVLRAEADALEVGT